MSAGKMPRKLFLFIAPNSYHLAGLLTGIPNLIFSQLTRTTGNLSRCFRNENSLFSYPRQVFEAAAENNHLALKNLLPHY